MLWTAVKVILALVALGVGVWLGLPGRYTQSVEDIEEAMERGGNQRRRVKKMFTPMAWMERKVGIRKAPSERRGFNIESPDDR